MHMRIHNLGKLILAHCTSQWGKSLRQYTPPIHNIDSVNYFVGLVCAHASRDLSLGQHVFSNASRSPSSPFAVARKSHNRMEEEVSVIVYNPNESNDQSFVPSFPSLKTETYPESSERVTLIHPFDGSVTDFRSQLVSSLATQEDVYISHVLSATNAVCLAGVDGMVCHSCVNLIQSTVSKERGVRGVRVSLSGNEALVEFDPTLINVDAVISAIDDVGFEARHIRTFTSKSLKSAVVATTRLETIVIEVEGMVCKSCVTNIQTNVGRKDGVKNISVSLQENNARITYDRGLLTTDQICTAIEELGFEAKCVGLSCAEVEVEVEEEGGDGVEVRRCCIKIEGMTCHSCVSLIESTLRDLEGVVTATVSLEKKEGVVEYDAGRVGEEDIKSAVEDTGFEVTSVSG